MMNFCDLLIEKNAGNIKSIFSYDENKILVVLNNSMDMEFFKINNKILKKNKNFVPLFLTMKHIQTSQDVFPIEFLEIKNTAKLIYGEDFLSEININLQNLRLQCEQQIKGMLIRYSQILLEIGDDKKKIKKMIHDSLENVFNILSGVIVLKENLYVSDRAEISANIKKHYGVDNFDLENIDDFLKKLQEIAYIVDGLSV